MRTHRNQPKLSMPVSKIHSISAAYRQGKTIEAKPVYRAGDWTPATRWNFVAYIYRVKS